VLSAAFHCFVTQFQHSNDNLDEGPPLREALDHGTGDDLTTLGKISMAVSKVRGRFQHVWLAWAHGDKTGGEQQHWEHLKLCQLRSDLIMTTQLKKHLSWAALSRVVVVGRIFGNNLPKAFV